MAESSAYIAKWTSAALGMSLMYRLKSLGPNKDPCGTPLRIGRGVQRLFSILILNSREFRSRQAGTSKNLLIFLCVRAVKRSFSVQCWVRTAFEGCQQSLPPSPEDDLLHC
ncbi:hypothetical protein TNCV_1232561 [Trichonephila clavipes]|nr:hypothetical protein TNCV_1232561 [Trichonephila clavipes]